MNPLAFRDPRVYQITALASLLLYGVAALDFQIGAAQAFVTLAGVLAAQWLCTTLFPGAGRFEARSALISGLSLCLLLRTNSLWLAALAPAVAVGSKFLLRWNGKGLFNPTNLALVVLPGGALDRGTAEGPQVQLALVVAVEGDPDVLEVHDLLGRLGAHDLDGVLIAEEV